MKHKSPNLADKISKDIIGIVDLIDELNSESMPLYVASSIRRIPPIGDQNTNMASIYSAIILVRNNVNLINEAITTLLISPNKVHINKDNDIPNICEHTSADISIDHSVPDTVVNKHETYAVRHTLQKYANRHQMRSSHYSRTSTTSRPRINVGIP